MVDYYKLLSNDTHRPDKNGRFGEFGGRFVPETLMPLILELERHYEKARKDKKFVDQIDYYFKDYIGRPTPLTFAPGLTAHFKGAKIYLKRDELNHTGAHKINNSIGQILLAKYMGKKRIIAETGAGQHGVATAAVAAKFDLPCTVYMGEEDIKRQAPNVFRMKLLGAKVEPVRSGTKTLKDAMNEAIRDWVTNVDDTFYIIGSAAGPHPYPVMVRDFQSIIGAEAREQILAKEDRLPDIVMACIGGGSNAIGLFHAFRDDTNVRIIGVEAAGEGLAGKHAAAISKGKAGVLHGMKSLILQTEDGQIDEAHSISAGLDYPGVGPEHAYLKATGRVSYVSATDEEALAAFKLIAQKEGIVPALEPSHAIAKIGDFATELGQDGLIIVNLCGRGDKDVFTVAEAMGIEL